MKGDVKVTKVETGRFNLYLVTVNDIEAGLIRKGRNTRKDTFPWQALAMPESPTISSALLGSYWGRGGKAQALATILAQ